MKRLTILAGLDTYSGYGNTAIAFARGIEAHTGARVAIRAVSVSERFGEKIPQDITDRIVRGVQADPWELVIHHPNIVPTPGKKTAMFTMNESTRLNPLQVHLLNKATVVIVPSEFCAVTFSASGVTSPIRVVPLGFDPAIFHWRPFPKNEGFVFGTAGGIAGGESRKGIQDVLEAFLKAFPKDKFPEVRLRIKCSPEKPLFFFGEDPRVDITFEYLSATGLADWYASLSCFVSVSKGEGFGLMQLEAMACGRPLIAPRFGGVADFLDRWSGYVLPHTLAPAPPPYAGHWCEVKESTLKDALQAAYIFQKSEPDMGRRTALNVADFTWLSATEKLIAVLEEFGALTDTTPEFHAL